jgi:hypothetical protein
MWLNSNSDWVHTAHAERALSTPQAMLLLVNNPHLPIYIDDRLIAAWLEMPCTSKEPSIRVMRKVIYGKSTPRYTQKLIQGAADDPIVCSMMKAFILGTYNHCTDLPPHRICMAVSRMSGAALYTHLNLALTSHGFHTIVNEYAIAGVFRHSPLRRALEAQGVDIIQHLSKFKKLNAVGGLRHWIYTTWDNPHQPPKTKRVVTTAVMTSKEDTVQTIAFYQALKKIFNSRGVRSQYPKASKSVLARYVAAGKAAAEQNIWPKLAVHRMIAKHMRNTTPKRMCTAIMRLVKTVHPVAWSKVVATMDGVFQAANVRVVHCFDTAPAKCNVAVCRNCRTIRTGVIGQNNRKRNRGILLDITRDTVICNGCHSDQIAEFDITRAMIRTSTTSSYITACRKCSQPTIATKILGTKILCKVCYNSELEKLNPKTCFCGVALRPPHAIIRCMYNKHGSLQRRGFCSWHATLGNRIALQDDVILQYIKKNERC